MVVPTHRLELAQATIDTLQASLTYPTEFHVLDGTRNKCRAINEALRTLVDPARHDLFVTVDDDLIFPGNWQQSLAMAFASIDNLGACGIDYSGSKTGRQLMGAARRAKLIRVGDVLYRDCTRLQNVAGGLIAMPAAIALQVGPYPFADDGRQHFLDEDCWRCSRVTSMGLRAGYVKIPNGVVQFVTYDDSPEYVAQKAADIANWIANPTWRNRAQGSA